MTRPCLTVGLLVGAVLEAAGSAPRLLGQAGTGTIKGVVVATSPRRPIEGARITLIGTEFRTTTDAKGLFELEDVAAGRYVIQAAAIGFTTLTSPVILKERETLDLQFETDAEAVQLPELSVDERSEYGPADWLRRKSEGRGRYITRKSIEERRVATLPDALRMVAGVRIECRGSQICVARMSRAPRGCGPSYFMDGIPTDQAALWLTPVTEIEGIEVYSGPSETPPELESAQARCGVIALWTRPPPPRQPKEKKPKKPPADSTPVKPDSIPSYR